MRGLSADTHTPLHWPVCFQGRSFVRWPLSAQLINRNFQVPRAPLHIRGVTSYAVMSGITSADVTLPSSLIRTHASILPPSPYLGCTLGKRSLQVAVSPCWGKDLPGVISANLSLRAWTHTPAAPVVLVPVSSHRTSAFPDD